MGGSEPQKTFQPGRGKFFHGARLRSLATATAGLLALGGVVDVGPEAPAAFLPAPNFCKARRTYWYTRM